MTNDPTLRKKTPETRLAELEQKHLGALMRIQALERWNSQLVARVRRIEDPVVEPDAERIIGIDPASGESRFAVQVVSLDSSATNLILGLIERLDGFEARLKKLENPACPHCGGQGGSWAATTGSFAPGGVEAGRYWIPCGECSGTGKISKEEPCDAEDSRQYIGDIGHHRPRAVPGV